VATATDTRTSRDRAPAVDDNIVDLTPAELEQLWAALDGDWITVLISLWPSWGFCPPHAFGFAITEVELQPRAFTTGPFRTAILYEHFLEGCGQDRQRSPAHLARNPPLPEPAHRLLHLRAARLHPLGRARTDAGLSLPVHSRAKASGGTVERPLAVSSPPRVARRVLVDR
jgi:hypothetical protein